MSTPEETQQQLPLTPREFEKPWMEIFIRLLAQGANVTLAAQGARIGKQWVHKVRKTDPVFAEAWQEALDIAIEHAEAIARRRALQGEKRTTTRTRRLRDETGKVIQEETTTEESTYISDTLLIFLLKAHKPEMYRERYDVRHQGHDGGAVKVEIDPIYRTPTRDRMIALLRLAQELEEPEVIEGEAVEITTNENGQHELEGGTNGAEPEA